MSDFGVGLVVGQSLGKSSLAEMQGVALGWRDRAAKLNNHLNEVDNHAGAIQFRLNAANKVLQEMTAEICESNPDSPYADKDFVRQRLAQLAVHFADLDGYDMDLEKNQAYPR